MGGHVKFTYDLLIYSHNCHSLVWSEGDYWIYDYEDIWYSYSTHKGSSTCEHLVQPLKIDQYTI